MPEFIQFIDAKIALIHTRTDWEMAEIHLKCISAVCFHFQLFCYRFELYFFLCVLRISIAHLCIEYFFLAQLFITHNFLFGFFFIVSDTCLSVHVFTSWISYGCVNIQSYDYEIAIQFRHGKKGILLYRRMLCACVSGHAHSYTQTLPSLNFRNWFLTFRCNERARQIHSLLIFLFFCSLLRKTKNVENSIIKWILDLCK